MREEKGNKKDVKITLDKLWENYFASESFPDIRKKFFDKRLFPYVEPLMKLRVFFNGDVDATFKKLENGIDFIASIFASFGGKLLKREALIKKFQERLKNEITCTKLADFLISSFVDVTQFGSTGKAGMAAGTFLQLKQFNMVTQYRYDYMAFGKVKTQLLRNYQITFDGLKEGSREFIGFIPADMEKAKEKFKMVLLLEMFDLATYEITGGQSPQLLVRINDPRKLAELCKEKYTNNVVADIEKRHTLSSATMTYFFETVMTDKERWNYIEDYFLGKRVATIEPKATEEEENEEVK